jgi:hypothetical protein
MLMRRRSLTESDLRQATPVVTTNSSALKGYVRDSPLCAAGHNGESLPYLIIAERTLSIDGGAAAAARRPSV